MKHPTSCLNGATPPLHRHHARAVRFSRSGATARPSSCSTSPRSPVNGHPEMKAGPAPGRAAAPKPPKPAAAEGAAARHPHLLKELGPQKFAEWMKAQKKVLLTDTTMRDGHQSLLATRMRSHRHDGIAPHYARQPAAALFSWNAGAARPSTWPALPQGRPLGAPARPARAMPNMLTQMLLRASNGVGYTNYPDNVVRYFVKQAAKDRRRRVPRVRLAQLGREHARGDGCRARDPARSARGDLLHRRPPRPGRRSMT
jgi:hypothetical protein